eukprot:SAG31_NODE_20354_length_577_cov_0.602510_1_plen_134_part_01
MPLTAAGHRATHGGARAWLLLLMLGSGAIWQQASAGDVWAAGNNEAGQLGDGTTTNRHSPVQISALGADVAAIAAGAGPEPGESHTVYLKASSDVWAVGKNDVGQLGDGTTTDRRDPVQISALGADVAAIAAGG